LLSLLVVPAVFTYIDDLERWLVRVLDRSGKRHNSVRPHHHKEEII